jgi:hypothetical protein
MGFTDWLSIVACLVGMFLPAAVAGVLFVVVGKFVLPLVDEEAT